MWSVAQAKAHLSEILRQARTGRPQVIGTQEPCMVVSLELYQARIASGTHDGLWLVEQAARAGCDIALPPRGEDRAPIVFAD